MKLYNPNKRLSMFKHITGPFTLPTHIAQATAELEEAQRELLKSLTAKEYATAMVDYHMSRTARLSDFLANAKGVAA